jgi:hypothetical protein
MNDHQQIDANSAMTPHVAAQMQDELLSAQTELDRLQRLLGDAVAQLQHRFTQAMDAQAQLPASTARAELSTAVSGAMVALQFEDLASQLITHSRRRLSSVADCLGNLAMGDDDAGCDVQWVARACPVDQRAVDAGSVELF